jgi:hypothetical protein
MVSTISAVIRISVEGGATSKIGEARFGKVPSDHNTTRIFEGPRAKNFQKKKNGGRGPTGPPTVGTSTTSVGYPVFPQLVAPLPRHDINDHGPLALTFTITNT